MPRYDGLGPDDDQTLPPPGNAVKDESPEGPIPRRQGQAGRLRPQENAELMAQGQVLTGHRGPRAKQHDEGPEKEPNQAEHAERISAESESERAGRGAKELQSAEAPTPPVRHPMGFWRGTGRILRVRAWSERASAPGNSHCALTHPYRDQ